MELLFVTVIAACIGLLVRYVTPGRDTYGALILPALAASVAAVVWVALVWFGWTFDGTWIWVASLTTATIAPIVTAAVLPGRRRRADAEMLETLSRP